MISGYWVYIMEEEEEEGEEIRMEEHGVDEWGNATVGREEKRG